MDLKSALRWSKKKLLQFISTSPDLDAEVILSFVLNKPKEFLYTHPDYQLSKKEIKKTQILVNRRAKGEPIAYLTGHKEFYSLNFLVNKHVLIPRPETELMVEEVVKKIRNQELKMKNKKIILIDIGTGSGCIPIAVLKTMKKNNYKTINCLAADISANALKIARQNAKKHEIKIKFLKSNLLSAFIKNSKFHPLRRLADDGPNSALFITANLPYLTARQMKEKSIQCEPRLALYGGKNGLELYKKLLSQIKILNTRYLPCPALPAGRRQAGQILNTIIEIDPAQSSKIKTHIKKILPSANWRTKTEIKKDLGGKNRLVILTLFQKQA